MTVEGTYYFTVSAISHDGVTHQDTVAITLMNKRQLPTMLRATWNTMKNNHCDNDTSTNVTYESPALKIAYQEMLNALAGQLPSIISGQIKFNPVYIGNGLANYSMVTSEDGIPYSYKVIVANGSKSGYIYCHDVIFFENQDGHWWIYDLLRSS